MSEILPPELDSPLLCSLQFPVPAPKQSVSAFKCVSEAEIAAISMFNESRGEDKVAKGNIVASRVLGHLLYVLYQRPTSITEPATNTIRREIFNDVKLKTQTRDSVIYEVGAMYHGDHLLRAFRKITSESPQISQNPSPQSFDIEEKLRNDVVSANLDFDTARKKALARDGYRCKLTLLWKASSCKEIRELATEAAASRTGRGTVDVCHIVNESFIQRTEGDPGARRPDSAATFLRILQTFGMGDVATVLAETNGVHSLANLLCLQSTGHGDFDSLGVWFEPTDSDTDHEYTIHTAYPIAEAYRHWQETVTFFVFPHRYETLRDAELARPDPKLLTLHGICARVANMSGAVKYFDEIDWDMEELTVLASDGSTSTAFLQSVLGSYTEQTRLDYE